MTGERALSLFAGIGGTALGQVNLGNDVTMVEKWDVAAETLRLNFPDRAVYEADVKAIDWHAFTGTDIILGGPPCQPFSQAAQGGTGEYDPRDCIPNFIDAVGTIQPRLFVMEEVKTLTWAKNRAYLDRVIGDLESYGYGVDYQVLDMSNYGVPQSRKRLFIVGRDDNRDVEWPVPHGTVTTMADALDWGPATAMDRAMAAPGEYAYPDWVFERPSTTVVGSFRPDVQAAPGYRKAGDPPRQNTPGSVVITVPEALALQGLPRDWKIAGNEAQQRLQIGNSCPPAMTAQIVAANGVE